MLAFCEGFPHEKADMTLAFLTHLLGFNKDTRWIKMAWKSYLDLSSIFFWFRGISISEKLTPWSSSSCWIVQVNRKDVDCGCDLAVFILCFCLSTFSASATTLNKLFPSIKYLFAFQYVDIGLILPPSLVVICFHDALSLSFHSICRMLRSILKSEKQLAHPADFNQNIFSLFQERWCLASSRKYFLFIILLEFLFEWS